MKQYGIYSVEFEKWEHNSQYDVYVFENRVIAQAQLESLGMKHFSSALMSGLHKREPIAYKYEVREFPVD